jgi:hypothetical protein
MKIDWGIIPKHQIDVSKLPDAYEICRVMKTHKIDKYVYKIMWKGLVIKFGMSADNSKNYGDRLYRQIGHSASWDKSRLVCSSGSDWRIIEEDFEKLYGLPLDKNSLSIIIYNLTNYPFETFHPQKEIYAIEQSLINQYKRVVGSKPLGNINDDKNIEKWNRVTKKTWNGLFDE